MKQFGELSQSVWGGSNAQKIPQYMLVWVTHTVSVHQCLFILMKARYFEQCSEWQQWTTITNKVFSLFPLSLPPEVTMLLCATEANTQSHWARNVVSIVPVFSFPLNISVAVYIVEWHGIYAVQDDVIFCKYFSKQRPEFSLVMKMSWKINFHLPSITTYG